MDEVLFNKIEEVLDANVRPALFAHMGDLEVCDLDDEGTLWILMTGECAGCPSADETVMNVVEKELLSRIPEIKKVEIDNGISDDIYDQALNLFSHRADQK